MAGETIAYRYRPMNIRSFNEIGVTDETEIFARVDDQAAFLGFIVAVAAVLLKVREM